MKILSRSRTSELMTEMIGTINEYNRSNVPVLKTELIKGTHATNYPYVLGVINAMIVCDYLEENDDGMYVTFNGMLFIGEIPF